MTLSNPKRGEIWQVDFDPTRGREIQKQRPAVVISSDALGKLPLKLVAPVTGWKEAFRDNLWHVHILPSKENGLTKESVVDVLQVRSVDTSRFMQRLGFIRDVQLQEVLEALAAVVEWS